MKNLLMVCKILVIIGALNWGLVGLLNFNLVALLLGKMTMLSRLVYILVGVCGVVEIFQMKK